MLKKHPFCGAFLVFWGFKFLSIKMKITRQLKFIGFASEPAITLNLLSGQKINGHIGLPA
ncbi:hypothetical protein RAX97_004933 [Salmonella enterica subsp. enterica serovar Derby]|nr:hypothetical protein [Escherichia coli]ELG2597624.1 hypothetical protein [Salmonella enterica subsp. enterica serovar Derby]ELG2598706.1 hypothetical protein [Salmonella enterica subsp. enterica serovar Derby]